MPGGWTFCARRALSVAAALLLVLPGFGIGSDPAFAAATKLPFKTFFELYVDQARRHVFVSGGSGTDAVLVFGFDGRIVKTLTGLAGAADMVVDGDRMYVALSNAAEIAVVDLKSLETVDRISIAPYAQPKYLSKSRDTIYFTHSCTDHSGEFASVDLATRVPLEHSDSAIAGCVEHAVVPSDPNTMLLWDERGMTPLKRFNVTARRPLFVDETAGRQWLDDVQFSSDGETFYARHTLYYSESYGIDQRRLTDLGVVMNYPGGGTSYALTPDERTLYSTYSYDGDLVVFRTGSPRPVSRLDLDEDPYAEDESIMPDSLGAAAGGDRAFGVVTHGGYYYDADLSFRVMWPQQRVAAGPGEQSTPAAGSGYELWTTGRARARHLALVARKDGKTFRVNPPRTTGYAGGVDGTKLVYQLVRGRQSDLRLYDLARRRQLSTLDRINTRGWEWHPTISQGRVLFARQRGKASQVIVQSLNGGPPRVLDRESGDGALVAGQVNGAFVVWTACERVCDVYRVNLRTGGRTKVPRPRRRLNYGASVTKDGVVYYMQSGYGCGTNAMLMRFSQGRVTKIEDFVGGKDGFFTFADDANDRVLFDVAECNVRNAGYRWDVFAFRDRPSAGDAAGRAPQPGADSEPAPPLEGEPWFDDLLPGGPR